MVKIDSMDRMLQKTSRQAEIIQGYVWAVGGGLLLAMVIVAAFFGTLCLGADVFKSLL